MRELSFTFALAQASVLNILPVPYSDRALRPRTLWDTHRLSLFTMLFRGLGEVALASGAASTSQDRA